MEVTINPVATVAMFPVLYVSQIFWIFEWSRNKIKYEYISSSTISNRKDILNFPTTAKEKLSQTGRQEVKLSLSTEETKLGNLQFFHALL